MSLAAISAVRAFLERFAIRETRLLISLSGGTDSTALMRLLHQLRDEFQLELLAVHFDHGLRAKSADEARWVGELCRTLDVEVQIESLSVTRGQSVDNASGIEERARELRYSALARFAEQFRCCFVATAHTANDQVETVLQRLLRGTGLWGLTGIRESRPLGSATLVRPLQRLTRAELETYLNSIGQSWLEDASNRDPRWTRNRIRHELLPQLRKTFNPQVDEHILGLAEHVRAVMAFVEREATTLRDTALLESQPTLQKWDADRLREAEPFLRSEALRLRWRELRWSELGMTRPHWESLAQLVDTPAPAMLHLPGQITAKRRGNLLVLETSPSAESNV